MPFSYCNLNDVKRWLAGLDVSEMPENLDAIIEQTWIPWAKREIDSFLGQNLDHTTVNEFYDGKGTKELVLRHSPVSFVRKCKLRIIPSAIWIEFKRWFLVNEHTITGVKVADRGGVEPINGTVTPPYTFPTSATVPDDVKVSSGHTANFNNTDAQFNNIDLIVNCRLGIITIPPTVLYIENQGVPFWNYTFIPGVSNVEVEYDYGYKNLESLPNEVRQASAQLIAAMVLMNKGQFSGAGTVSLTHDSISKSFGNAPFGNYIQMYVDSAKKSLAPYKRIGV